MKSQTKIGNLISILLCGIGIQFAFITVILNDNIVFKFWKELLIILLLINTLMIKERHKVRKNTYIDFYDIYIFLFIVSLIGSAVILTDKLVNGILVARIYIIPIVVYYIAKNNSQLDKNVVLKIIKTVIIFYSILSIWGIFQAWVLGDKFLIDLGYPLKYEGRLRDSFYFGGFGNMQRVVSTFSNTNVFGTVIGILIILIIRNKEFLIDMKYRKIYLFILFCAFILTFSRSNWLAMTLIMLIISVRNKIILKKIIKIVAILIPIALICILASKVNIFSIIGKYLNDTFKLTDPSAAGRFGIWKEAMDTFFHNPFGIGLGKVGMLANNISGNMEVVGESSYFAILLDTGIQGAICYFAAIICNIIIKRNISYLNKVQKQFIETSRYIIVYLLIMFLFSNHIYDLELMIMAFFFIGLSRNTVFFNSLN